MLVKNDKGFYTLSSFNNFKNVVCGFSTVEFGNMKPFRKGQEAVVERNRNNFFRALGLTRQDFVTAQQIHKNKIAVVGSEDAGKESKGADGLVTKAANLFLLIFVADCLPIVAFDPVQKIVGVAHAGWRGTLAKIAENLIDAFGQLGSNSKDILIGLGPAVEVCHYEVKSDRAREFRLAGFGKSVLESVSGKIYLDLKKANADQLKTVGVLEENIEVTPKACTYETADFYSFRRQGKYPPDEIACLIGLKDG